MLDVLDRKIQRMHAALAALSSDYAVIPVIEIAHTFGPVGVDFNADSDSIELANKASLLIANIASLKDHLKLWCKSKSIPFNGEKLINSNRSVALIHDLWNVDKHAELAKPPRSGTVPKLVNLANGLCTEPGTSLTFDISATFTPLGNSGQVITTMSEGGSASIRLAGTIVDSAGNFLADFYTTCREAADAWENELVAVGVALSSEE